MLSEMRGIDDDAAEGKASRRMKIGKLTVTGVPQPQKSGERRRLRAKNMERGSHGCAFL